MYYHVYRMTCHRSIRLHNPNDVIDRRVALYYVVFISRSVVPQSIIP